MSHPLIDREEDLRRLRNEGYNIAITDGYVVIHEVPYLNETGEVCFGAVICALAPSDHTVLFCGTYPHRADRSPIDTIQAGAKEVDVGDGLRTNLRFSSKPSSGKYDDRHHQITRYIEIIENQARSIDPSVTSKTFPAIRESDEESVFKYVDTASSRAEITAVSRKLKKSRIAIVGMGGTGSYVLDLVSKTHVREIHLFDEDIFSQHNAFRSPGAASFEELDAKPPQKKVEYMTTKYEKMRHGIVPHVARITEANSEILDDFDFVFLCLDASDDKRAVVNHLAEKEIPFVDTGIGLREIDGALYGQVRLTTSSNKKRVPSTGRISYGTPNPDALYTTNIQVAEINALAASFAVIKWKKLFGLYVDKKEEHNTIYMIEENEVINEDVAED